MLEKTSVSMMVLLVAASLIGISSIHQYVEGQTPKPQPLIYKSVLGRVDSATIERGHCSAFVVLPDEGVNPLRLKPGALIALSAPSESFCILFGLSKIGNTQIVFDAQKIESGGVTIYRVTRVMLQ